MKLTAPTYEKEKRNLNQTTLGYNTVDNIVDEREAMIENIFSRRSGYNASSSNRTGVTSVFYLKGLS
jgi:hypothetical protein